MTRTARYEDLLERGVWKAPYLFDGVEVLIAVDSRGGVRKHVKLRPGVDEFRAAAWLEALLERLDPARPHLELVKPRSEPPQRIDPRSYEAARAFERRLAKQAAQHRTWLRPDLR